jgi:hypothetical protein
MAEYRISKDQSAGTRAISQPANIVRIRLRVKLGRPAPSAACLLILRNSPSKRTFRFGSSVPQGDIDLLFDHLIGERVRNEQQRRFADMQDHLKRASMV